MALEGDLDYALARVQARHGELAPEADWRRLAASRDLGHYLDVARAGSFARWVSSLDATRDSHAIERSLRALWSDYVLEVASWHPRIWQPWLAWLAWVPALSLLAQLAHPEPAPTWLPADPLLGPVAAGTPAERGAALEHTDLAPLASALRAARPLAGAWYAEWRRRLPTTDARTRELIDALLRILTMHAHSLEQARDSAWPLRRQLAARLRVLFRRGAGTAVATVCHLGLVAIDLERLRGGIVRRRLLPSAVESP